MQRCILLLEVYSSQQILWGIEQGIITCYTNYPVNEWENRKEKNLEKFEQQNANISMSRKWANIKDESLAFFENSRWR